jgi:hypothetical protein
VVGADVYICQVGADFRFEVFCGILYKLGELDGEAERIVASPNHFSPKRARRRECAFNPCFGTLTAEVDMYLVLGKLS